MLLMLAFLIGAGASAQQYKSRSIKPGNYQEKVITISGEKKRSYYGLNTESASLISVSGPGILRVITRGRFIPSEEEEIDYKVVFLVDGGDVNDKKFKDVKRSKSATYQDGSLGVPGQLKDFEIDLGRGDHSIEFKLENNDNQVACRYIFTPVKPKKLEWISFCPKQPSEPVDLLSRESSVTYYRFSNETPLMVEVNGPTMLRVLTRIENHYQMKGRILYRVQVKKNNEVINTYQLSSRQSEVAGYKEKVDLIPGKACEFVIEVPKGRHKYEVVPLDKDKSTVLGRFLLPVKDVKLVN